jgi:hypothetical protein
VVADGTRAFCMLMYSHWNRFYGIMKTVGCILVDFENFSTYALCSDDHNICIVYRIWVYE